MCVDILRFQKLQALKVVKGSKVRAVNCTNVKKLCLGKIIPKNCLKPNFQLTKEEGLERVPAHFVH